MFLRSKHRVTCLYLFVCFLNVFSLYERDSANFLVWPSIAVHHNKIKITNCRKLASLPALAAAGRPELTHLQVSRCGVFQINDTWMQNSTNIEEINIKGNKLTSVPPFNCGAAGSEGCPNLKVISVGENPITSLPARSFVNHPKLEKLNLDQLKIVTLASFWIIDCPSVMELNLLKNPNLVNFLVSDDSESQGFGNLTLLKLNSCNISSIDRDLFLSSPKLKHLYINGNPIKTLPKFVASHPVKIHSATMKDFVCDCSTTKLAKNGMIDTDNQGKFCGSPDYNVGKKFSNLECRKEFKSVKESSEDISFLLDQDNTNYLLLTRTHHVLLSTIHDFSNISVEIAGLGLQGLSIQMSSPFGSNSFLVQLCRLGDSMETRVVFTCLCGQRPCSSINVDTLPIPNGKIQYFAIT